MPKSARLKGRPRTISIIGSGRLGTALALALTKTGYAVEALVARRLRSSRKVARLFPSRPLALAENELSRLPSSQLLLITTPDDVIEELAAKLARQIEPRSAGQTVLHTSGALSSTVLTPLAKRGFNIGSIHPLVSVSDPKLGSEALKYAFWCLEGDRKALSTARTVVRALAGHSFSIPAKRKALYHAAALMVSGHLTALVGLATEMLVPCGLSQFKARKVLLPLVQSTVRNLESYTPTQALTGPFARGDIATVERHLKSLSGLPPYLLDAYKILGRHSVKLAERKGMQPSQLAKMRRKLQ